MSKLSFRARQVDYTKPLPIYLNHDLPDLQDFAAINRSVPLMPTGMEKDEEAVSAILITFVYFSLITFTFSRTCLLN